MPRPVSQIAHDLLRNAEQAHDLNLELQAALSQADQDAATGGFSSPLQGGERRCPKCGDREGCHGGCACGYLSPSITGYPDVVVREPRSVVEHVAGRTVERFFAADGSCYKTNTLFTDEEAESGWPDALRP